MEDFWALMNYISEANNIPVGTDYSLFKVGKQILSQVPIENKKYLQKGIFPDWEDVRNARGGRWMVRVCNYFRWKDIELKFNSNVFLILV